MDLQLHCLSGLEAAGRLKNDASSKYIPIVAVTAFAMKWHAREALEGGCDAYLSKPITIGSLLKAIEPFLSRFPVPPVSNH